MDHRTLHCDQIKHDLPCCYETIAIIIDNSKVGPTAMMIKQLHVCERCQLHLPAGSKVLMDEFDELNCKTTSLPEMRVSQVMQPKP